MALIPAPKEVLGIGRIMRDEVTGNPIFPDGTTKEQIAAYNEWHKKIKEANTPEVEE